MYTCCADNDHCEAGKFVTTPSTATASSVCGTCAQGTFSNSQDADLCTACPSGYSQPAVGSMQCLPCIPGEHQSNRGSQECTKCPADTFSGAMASIVCNSCPSGQNVNAGSMGCNNHTALTNAKLALETERDELRAAKQQLENANQTCRLEKQALETDKASLELDKASLQVEKDTCDGLVDNTSTRLSNLQSDFDTLQVEKMNLAAEKVSEKVECDGTVSNLTATKNTLENNIDQCETNLNEEKQTIMRMNSSFLADKQSFDIEQQQMVESKTILEKQLNAVTAAKTNLTVAKATCDTRVIEMVAQSEDEAIVASQYQMICEGFESSLMEYKTNKTVMEQQVTTLTEDVKQAVADKDKAVKEKKAAEAAAVAAKKEAKSAKAAAAAAGGAGDPTNVVLTQKITMEGIEKSQINDKEKLKKIEAKIAAYLDVDPSNVKISDVETVTSSTGASETNIEYEVTGQDSAAENKAVETKMNDMKTASTVENSPANSIIDSVAEEAGVPVDDLDFKPSSAAAQPNGDANSDANAGGAGVNNNNGSSSIEDTEMSLTVMLLLTLCVILCLSNLVSLCCCWRRQKMLDDITMATKVNQGNTLLHDDTEFIYAENTAYRPSETELSVVSVDAGNRKKGRMRGVEAPKNRLTSKRVRRASIDKVKKTFGQLRTIDFESGAAPNGANPLYSAETKDSPKKKGLGEKKKSFRKHVDATTNQPYYHCEVTQQTQWEQPAAHEMIQESPQPVEESANPTTGTMGSKKLSFRRLNTSDGGREYFQNVDNLETVWTVPNDGEVL